MDDPQPDAAQPDAAQPDAAHEEFRPLLFSIAYRMMGSVADAEDIVQEAFLRYGRSERADDDRCIAAGVPDHDRDPAGDRPAAVGAGPARGVRRAVAAGAAGHRRRRRPAGRAEMADSLSLAFLVLLESLSPVERAVFLLREVFDYDYDEIAGIVGKSEANCRQIFAPRAAASTRASRASRPRGEQRRADRPVLRGRRRGRHRAFIEMLAADVVFYGDGGGKGQSIPAPIYGRERVARLLRGLGGRAQQLAVAARPVLVNGQPGVVSFDQDGKLVAVMAFDVADGKVQVIRSMVNPDKLRHLGETSEAFVRPDR